MHQISREPLNGSAPNSQQRRVLSLAQTSLNVKVKGEGHQGQKLKNCCVIPIDNALEGVRCTPYMTSSGSGCRVDHSIAAGGVTGVHADGGLRAVYVG